MSQLVIYEGVFDPPHLGHYLVVQNIIESTGAHVLVCPSTDEATKQISKKDKASDYKTRLAMCQLGFPNAIVYKHKNLYTIDLLHEIHAHFAFLKLSLTYGPDWSIEKYHQADDVRTLAAFIKAESKVDIRSTTIRNRITKGLPIKGLVLQEVETFLDGSTIYG
jgi:cytidyltransferase-like protein